MPESTAEREDLRLAQIRIWLKGLLKGADFSLAPASADASFRRYFRVSHGDTSNIVMDAPPAQEDSAPFVRIASLLADANVHVPKVLEQDLQRGFLLLTDLGRQTYLNVITPDNADALFKDAIQALLDWQCVSRPNVLPEYDAPELLRELQLFPDWYIARHKKITLNRVEQQALDGLFQTIIEKALAQSQVFVHRDYMPRNLMLSDPNPGVLDFQDARYGPIAYDVLSLFKDAFISWPQERVTQWTQHYWQAAHDRGLPVPIKFDDFQHDVDWIGVQRHLKVLGIFARIHHRDGKPQYLKDAPRFLNYLMPVVAKYPELAPLGDLLNKLESQ